MNHLAHVVQPGVFSAHKDGSVHSAYGKDLFASCRVRQSNDLVPAGKDDLMLAYNGAASYSMNADLITGARITLGEHVILELHRMIDLLAHGVCQHQCSAAGRVDLLIMVLFHNLNIKVRSQYIDRFLC